MRSASQIDSDPNNAKNPLNPEDIIEHSVSRALDLFGLDTGKMHRWGEDIGLESSPPIETA